MEQLKTQINLKEEKCNQIEVTEYISYSIKCIRSCIPTATAAESSERLWGVVRAAPDPERSCCRIT